MAMASCSGNRERERGERRKREGRRRALGVPDQQMSSAAACRTAATGGRVGSERIAGGRGGFLGPRKDFSRGSTQKSGSCRGDRGRGALAGLADPASARAEHSIWNIDLDGRLLMQYEQ